MLPTLLIAVLFGLAAIGSSASAQDVTEGELNSEMRFQGGQYVFHYDWQVVTGDVTCDGDADKVAAYVDLDDPEGKNFFTVVVTHEEGQLISEVVAPYFDSGDQAGLCGTGDPAPILSLETFTDDEAREMTGLEEVCPVAITVDDGLCDAHRYFWVPGMELDEHLVLFRN